MSEIFKNSLTFRLFKRNHLSLMVFALIDMSDSVSKYNQDKNGNRSRHKFSPRRLVRR